MNPMCYTMTIVIDKSGTDILARELSGAFTVLANKNPSIAKQLSAGDRAFDVVAGGCSCDLLGAQTLPDEIKKLEKKYKSKGWSDKKIERTLADKLSGRKDENAPLRLEFGKRLGEVVARTGRILLVVHWYQGATESEPVPIQGKLVKARQDLFDFAQNIPEDMLVEIMA